MLVRLLYVSRAADDQASAELTESIMSAARTYNAVNGITGVLCYGSGVFLQAIEGGRDEINALYNMILKDDRHVNVVLLHYDEIQERRFGGWTMGQVNLAKLNTSVVLKYSETPELNPYRMSGKVAFALLEELMLTASVIGKA